MKETDFIPLPFDTRYKRKLDLKVGFRSIAILLIIGVSGIVLSYLNVSGNWIIAAVVMSIVPALILLHQYPFFGVLVWLMLMPFLLQTQSNTSRQVYWIIHRFLPLLSLIFLWVGSAAGVRKRSLPKLGYPEYSMVTYILISILSILLWHNDPGATIIRFYDLFVVPMFLYLLIRLFAPGEKSMEFLVPIALFITITQVTIGLLAWYYPYMLPSAWLQYAGERTTGSLQSVSVFTTTIFFTGLLLLNVGLRADKKWKRYLFVSMFFLMIYATFISYSRASWLAGILILGALVLVYPKFMGKFLLIAALLGILLGSVLLSTSGFQTAASRLYSDESEQSALSRLPVYVAAVRMFQEKPIMGWGYDNFDRYDRRYQSRFGQLVNPDEKDHTSHNVYLTMLAEQGLLGITSYLLPFAILFFRSLKTLPNLPKRGWFTDKMLISLWLVILSFFVVQNFAPMVVVFGMGLNWVVMGLIANYVHLYGPGK